MRHHAPADDGAAHHEHHVAVAVVGALAAVLARHAAELRHRHDGDAIHAFGGVHVDMERGERAGELLHQLRHAAVERALRAVRVPAAESICTASMPMSARMSAAVDRSALPKPPPG